jgi:predicted DNA-binding protein (MmcQ/YjbR family)
MDFETLRAYLLQKPGATEDTPFGPDTLVIKAADKMFALIAFQEQPLRVSLKCDPTHAELLRSTYAAVQPGYYLNKRHWNTITLDGSIPEDVFLMMIDESYQLVVKGLSKAARQQLQDLEA